jgi:hypothetical protein
MIAACAELRLSLGSLAGGRKRARPIIASSQHLQTRRNITLAIGHTSTPRTSIPPSPAMRRSVGSIPIASACRP